MAKQQTRGAMLPDERALYERCQRADDFKAIVAHLKAARAMIVASDLDQNEILSLFSNAAIPVFPAIVADIMADRFVRQMFNEQ
jgi:hypothetical protein